MRHERGDLPRPPAALLVVGTVDLEHVHPLLKVGVSEVVEVGRATIRTGVVHCDALLDAVVTVVAPAADHLPGLLQDLGAELAHQLLGNLAHKAVGMPVELSIVLAWTGVVQGHYLEGENERQRRIVHCG